MPDKSQPRFREVFANRDFLKLWLGQIVSSMGDRFYQFALLSIVFGIEAGQKAGPESARILFFSLLPGLIFGPFLGVVVDVFDRKKVMIFSDLSRALLVLMIPFLWMRTGELTWVFGVLFAMGTMSCIFIPARQSVLPALVPPRHLMVANSLVSVAGVVANCLGVLAGVLFNSIFPAYNGAYSGFVINSMALVVSALFLISIRENLKPLRNEHPFESIWLDFRAGLRFVAGDRTVLTLVGLHGVFTFILGLFVPIVLAFLAAPGVLNYSGWQALTDQASVWIGQFVSKPPRFQIENLALGILTAAMATGLAAGIWVVAKVPKISHWAGLPYLCFFLLGFGFAAISQISSYTLLFGLVVLMGLLMAGVLIPIDTRLQIHVADRFRGRVFAVRGMVFTAAFLLAQMFLISEKLFRQYGPIKMMLCLGGLAAISAVICYVATPRHLKTGRF